MINGRDFNSSPNTRHHYCTESSRWNLFNWNTVPFKLRRVSEQKNLLTRCEEKSFFVYVSYGEWVLLSYYPARSDSSLVAEIQQGRFVAWYNRRSYSGDYACSSRWCFNYLKTWWTKSAAQIKIRIIFSMSWIERLEAAFSRVIFSWDVNIHDAMNVIGCFEKL